MENLNTLDPERERQILRTLSIHHFSKILDHNKELLEEIEVLKKKVKRYKQFLDMCDNDDIALCGNCRDDFVDIDDYCGRCNCGGTHYCEDCIENLDHCCTDNCKNFMYDGTKVIFCCDDCHSGTCDICNKKLCESCAKDLIQCKKCNAKFCIDCSYECDGCTKQFCKKYTPKKKCDDCDRKFCESCSDKLKKCECNSYVCNVCYEVYDCCDDQILCNNCITKFEEKYLKKCEKCNKDMLLCTEHMDKKSVCEMCK